MDQTDFSLVSMLISLILTSLPFTYIHKFIRLGGSTKATLKADVDQPMKSVKKIKICNTKILKYIEKCIWSKVRPIGLININKGITNTLPLMKVVSK